MASGHVNRIYRPNTWQHRPSLRREDFSCQPGAVHTWHEKDMSAASRSVCFRGRSGERHRRGLVTVELPRRVIPKELASGKATSKVANVEALAH
jgi:hypothetical protein